MKTACLVMTLLLSNHFDPKPKFKYIDKYAPLYISARGPQPDMQDTVSTFLKDTIGKMKIKLVSLVEYRELAKQYFEDIRSDISNMKPRKENQSLEDWMLPMYARGTPSQHLTIVYTSETDRQSTLESCDSIGFLMIKYPIRSLTKPYLRNMWHIKEIGSRSADTVALFLLKKI